MATFREVYFCPDRPNEESAVIVTEVSDTHISVRKYVLTDRERDIDMIRSGAQDVDAHYINQGNM